MEMDDSYGIMPERPAVIETVKRMFIHTDNREWPKVKELFTDEVLFDMTSMNGGEPVIMTPQQIVDGWDRGLKALKAVHHQTSNYVIKIAGSEAEAFCYVIAYHYLPNITGRNTRIFVGSYDLHLKKGSGDAPSSWRIDKFKFNLKFVDGNPNLEEDGA